MTEKRIFIIEDSQDIQSLLETLLRSNGYIVESASNGQDALVRLNSHDAPMPDVILLDLMMPEMDGFQFKEAQNKSERLSKIPVVLMTASGNVQSKTDELGIHGFLKKPFKSVDAIIEAIEQCFNVC